MSKQVRNPHFSNPEDTADGSLDDQTNNVNEAVSYNDVSALYMNNSGYNPTSSSSIVKPAAYNNPNSSFAPNDPLNNNQPGMKMSPSSPYFNNQLLLQENGGDFSEIQTIDVNDNDYGNWDEIGPLTFQTYAERHYRELGFIALALFIGLGCLIGAIISFIMNNVIAGVILLLFGLFLSSFGVYFSIQFQGSFSRKEPFLFRLPFFEQQ